jgi:tRNA (guanine-N7-)-methyltransferase
MPQRNPDPFQSRAAHLNATVNPYVAVLRDAAKDGSLPLAFGAQLEGLAGRWRSRFPSPPDKLVLEIGCHKGQTLLAMAKDMPATGFVGLDITYKRVVTTAQRVKAQGVPNAFLAMANARALAKLFAPGELDGVVIFFPDPWVKKARQAKHRLVDASFIAQLATVVAPGGFVWLKTDQEIYFAGAREAFTEHGAAFAATTTLAGMTDVNYTSAFEQRFHAQNLPTFAGKWSRTAALAAAHA